MQTRRAVMIAVLVVLFQLLSGCAASDESSIGEDPAAPAGTDSTEMPGSVVRFEAIAESNVDVQPDAVVVRWEGEGPQGILAVHQLDEPASSVSGHLDLNTGIQREEGDRGGVFFHVFSEPEPGSAGGQDAQVGMVNTDLGAVLDGASGVCVAAPPDETCFGTGSNYSNIVENDDPGQDVVVDNGLRFRFSVEAEVMTLTVEVDDRVWETSRQFPADEIRSVALSTWGSSRNFDASLSEVALD